jgi:uncharacterized repeat protein (TIGR01451 family)
MRVTPDRVMAPVGSEVVLKSGICGADGYLVANQRVEWLLTPGGTGQFADLGDREQFQVLRLPWNMARKIDNTYAVGSTSAAPVCLHRGTPDPADDVQILRGDAWITVTSASEGVSHVTAFTPAISDWNLRKATATIYWVDAQWVLPASTIVPAGRPHVLTTTVMRRTDGAPLAGWLVRYEVPGGASLGYGGGNVADVATDAAGRASVEVSPTDVGGGSTTVGITVVRPPQAGVAAAPQLEVGRGSATLTWATGAAPIPMAPAPISPGPMSPLPITPMQPGPPPALEPTPQPSLPATTTPAERDPYIPPRDAPSPGRPRLEVQLNRSTPEQVAVGGFARFTVTVTNAGDGPARGIRIRDRFDRGLRHEHAQPGESAIDYPGMRDLAPGESETIPLTFEVVEGGTQCHDVTVTAEGAEPATGRGCVTGQPAALEVSANGPRSRVVGQIAEFSAVIKNVGGVAATNVEVVVRCDEPLEPSRAEQGHERLPNGDLVLRFNDLEPNERRTFRMEALCRSQSNNACARFIVTADGGATAAAEACVEILPQLPAGQGGQAPTAAPDNVRLTITETQNPARVGTRQVVYLTVRNEGQQVARQVAVRVLLPQEMSVVADQIQPAGDSQVLGREIRFTSITELPPQEERQYVIPISPDRAGSVQIRAEWAAEGLAQPVAVESNTIQILPQ